MNINECYKTLNLSIDSSLEEVKKSYRKLAKIYHPDINPNGNEMFTSINEAYNYILEYKKNNNFKENNKNNPYNYKKSYKRSYTSTKYNNNYTYTNDSLWDDILNKNYNNNNHSYSQQVKGSNIFLEYKLTQEDFKSINNKDFIYKEIYYKKKSICISCQGTGKEIKICPDCNGSGINKSNKNKVITNCNTCKGLGTVEGYSLCSVCKGSGFVEKN
ncbi:DnaJ domain-containing protein, partial [Arthrospira platensis SPKY2]